MATLLERGGGMITQHSIAFGRLHNADKNTVEVTAILTIKVKSRVAQLEAAATAFTVEDISRVLCNETKAEIGKYIHE